MCDTASSSTFFSPFPLKKKQYRGEFCGGFNDSDPQIDRDNPKASKSRW